MAFKRHDVFLSIGQYCRCGFLVQLIMESTVKTLSTAEKDIILHEGHIIRLERIYGALLSDYADLEPRYREINGELEVGKGSSDKSVASNYPSGVR